MKLHVHHRYAKRQHNAARRLRRNPQQPVVQTLNKLAEPYSAPPKTSQRISLEAQHLLGINDNGALSSATAEEAAQMLETQQPEIMANCHATWMSSVWIYFDQPVQHHPDFYRDVLDIAVRSTWTGHPFIPANRLELPDGSAFVIYGSQISSAVHRERVDLIADAYLEAARKSLSRITAATRRESHRGIMPLVPHPAYAPAWDGILSHQAALPVDFDRCWCYSNHEPEDDPNQVMP